MRLGAGRVESNLEPWGLSGSPDLARRHSSPGQDEPQGTGRVWLPALVALDVCRAWSPAVDGRVESFFEPHGRFRIPGPRPPHPSR